MRDFFCVCDYLIVESGVGVVQSWVTIFWTFSANRQFIEPLYTVGFHNVIVYSSHPSPWCYIQQFFTSFLLTLLPRFMLRPLVVPALHLTKQKITVHQDGPGAWRLWLGYPLLSSLSRWAASGPSLPLGLTTLASGTVFFDHLKSRYFFFYYSETIVLIFMNISVSWLKRCFCFYNHKSFPYTSLSAVVRLDKHILALV